jgi:uridine kinase
MTHEANLPFPPTLVGISGASGSGKTTLAAQLARTLGGLHFSLDNYYRDLGHMPYQRRTEQNFDDPAMFENSLLAHHVAALGRSEAIERPLYDFATYTRVAGKTERIGPIAGPGALVVVEGLFALYYPELRPFYHLKVYVDTPDDLCFARRLKRDIEERGRDPESVRKQYDATVRPCSLAFVRPLVDFADLVVEGGDPLDFKVEQVLATMKKRGLMRKPESAD